MIRLRLAISWLFVTLASAFLSLVFSVSVDCASTIFETWTVLILFMPLAGVVTYGLYALLGVSFLTGTARVVTQMKEEKPPSWRLIPGIFFGTCLTIIAGGSVGKEAASLQMGAASASIVNYIWRSKSKGSAWSITQHKLRVLAECGMAASLGILLGTPIAACVFVLELLGDSIKDISAICMVFSSSVVGCILTKISPANSVDIMSRQVVFPEFSVDQLGQFALLLLASSLVGVLFCFLVIGGRLLATRLKCHPCFVLVAVGIVFSSIIYGTGSFEVSGTGLQEILLAFDAKVTDSFFAMKALATALLLAGGFKGGEIMPTLCIGAAFGAVAGAILGMDVAFAACIGLVVVFSVCTNCPFAAFFLACECFGFEGMIWFGIAAALAFLLTFRISLYSGFKNFTRA